jgi:MFS family permease
LFPLTCILLFRLLKFKYMTMQLSPYRLSKARDVYNFFNVLNAVSWNLLVGIIITLFALRLDASSTYIGLMSSAFYIALFLLPLGKLLAKRFSIIGIFSFTWIMRSICMILAAAAPFVDYAGHRNIALLLVIIGVFLFHLFRGVGMIGNNPVLSLLASGPDRGSYMTQIQIINSAIGMFGSFLIAMVLGMEPPIFVFSILLAIGVITGVISGYVIRKVPEPSIQQEANDGLKKEKIKFTDIFKDAFSNDHLRNFLIIFFLVILVSGVTRTFVIVYAREVFGHNDGLISLYSVFGGLGYLMVGLIVKFLVDRVGAKPLFLVCVILGLISLIPVIFIPLTAVDNVAGSILFLAFLFFMLNFGFLGSEGIAQTYFFGLVPPEKTLDMGILYFFILGIAGASGSFLAGLFLDFFRFIGFSHFLAFKILFIIMIALTVLALSMQKKMKPLGSLPLSNALEVIFSVRDLRAISLLGKLNKAEDSSQEKILLGELHNTPSHLAIDGILERACSPKMATRTEAIRALEMLHKLSKKAEKALVDDAVNNPYTTAYISARILGKHNCTEAIPMLRKITKSGDYMLAGEAIIALAKMKDEAFRPEIEKLILSSDNPRLKIMGAEALGIYHNVESVHVLLGLLREKDPPPYLRDEIILAIATIIDTQKKFYKILAKFASDNSLAETLAADEAEEALEFVKTALGKKKVSDEKISEVKSFAENFQNAVIKYVKENDGASLSRLILELPDEYLKAESIIKSVFSEAVIDNDLSGYNSLRLLIVHWSAQELRIWAVMLR